jgi:hypothetical protein
MKQYHTYLHRGADGRVFYVGCASAYMDKSTLKSKYQRAFANSGHMPAWYAAASNGYSVEIREHFDDRAVAFSAEIKLIQEMRDKGEPLVNICDGGAGMPGVKDSIEVRLKKSITKIGILNPMHSKTGAEHPMSRKVRDSATGDVYDSVQIAADATGQKMKTLYNWLSGHRKNPTTLEFA